MADMLGIISQIAMLMAHQRVSMHTGKTLGIELRGNNLQ
jgi:hypothetical protein